MSGPEAELVALCIDVAENHMNAMVAVVGQRKAKGSGTSIGFPDLVVLASGKIALIEMKRTKSRDDSGGTLNLGQLAFIEKAALKGVKVHVIDNVTDFIAVINGMRKSTRQVHG